MTNGFAPRPPGRVRGRPFEKGQSGNPARRRVGCRNKTTIAAASLLEGEAEALTRRAVELALVGDPTAMRLCIERILPPCRERTVKFVLPPIESAADIAPAMKAVTSALAGGMITPGRRRRSRRWSTPLSGRSRPATLSGVCSWSRPTAPTTRMPLPACTAPGRVSASTRRRDFAADSLHMAGSAIFDAIRDCGAPAPG
jgi:Family of unknown function (DUF5681)